MIEFSKIEEIRDLISNAKLTLALQELKKMTHEFEDIELKDELIIIQNRLSTLNGQSRLGIENVEYKDIKNSQITNSILQFIRQLERQNHKQKKENLLDFSENKLLEAAKSAIILVDLEKIKHRYYYSELHERADILDELRIYKPISTDIATVEIYNFLFEVADSINYKSPNNFGLSLFSLVIYFFPNDTEKVDTILSLSINIGSLLIVASIFNFQNFKIGVYGLSTWKWVYLRAKSRGKETIMERVKAEHTKIKKLFLEENVKISNYESKIQLIEIFEEDLEKPGLTFPMIPDDILRII